VRLDRSTESAPQKARGPPPEIHRAGLAQLEATDPELFKAVQRIMWENGLQDLGMPLEEWKIRAIRRVRRRSKVRAEMQRAGSI
jgi:hypothetical protein